MNIYLGIPQIIFVALQLVVLLLIQALSFAGMAYSVAKRKPSVSAGRAILVQGLAVLFIDAILWFGGFFTYCNNTP